MNRKHRRLMEDLRAAKPALPVDLDTWNSSENSRRILAEILATAPGPDRPPVPKTRRASGRLVALAGVAVLVVALAGVLSLYLGDGAEDEGFVYQPSVTTAVTHSEGAITAAEVLGDLIGLSESVGRITQGRGNPGPEREVDNIVEAGALGILDSTESATVQLDDSVTRRQLALWLWRGFGRLLPEGSAVAAGSDLGALAPDEQEAVAGLVRSGVIRLPEDGLFRGDEIVGPTEVAAALEGVAALLEESAGRP